VDEYGRTPLHYAAAEGDAARVQDLLRAGANPNAQDDNSWSPLHFAAQAVSTAAVAALIEAGADVDALDRFGNTPLFRAVFCSKDEGGVIQLLRASGADPRLSNIRGVSPLNLARTIANFDLAQFFADLA